MKTALSMLIGVLVLASSAVAATTYPLADRLPDNTTVYVGWAGRGEAFDNSAMGKLLAEPQVRQMVEALRVNVLAKASQKPQGDTRVGAEHLWAMAELALAHPMALGAAWGGLSVGAASVPASVPAGVDPRLATVSRVYLIARLQDDKNAFAEHLEAVWSLLAIGQKSDQTYSTVSYRVVSSGDVGMAVGFVEDVFFICEAKMAPALIDRLGGKGGSLADKAGFVEAMRQVSGDNVQVAAYADVTSIKGMVAGLAGPQFAEAKGKLALLGLDKITAIAGCGCLEEGMAHGRVKVFTPAPHQGVLMLLSGKPLDLAALADVPADADLVASVRLDVLAVYEELERILAAADPAASQRMAMGVTGAGQMLGIDFKADLLAALGDEWTLMTAASNGGFLSGTVLVCQLRNPERFAQTQNLLEAYAKNLVGQVDEPAAGSRPALAATRPAKAVRPKPFELRATKMGGVDIHYVWMPGQNSPVAPAWAVVNGRLYIAAWPQVVAGVLENKAPRLAETAEFKAMRGKVSPNANMLLYINDPQLLRQFYGVLVGGGTFLMSQAAPGLTDVLRPEMIPSLPTLLKYVKPELRSISADDRGIMLEAYGTLPGPTALAPIVAPLAALAAVNRGQSQLATLRQQTEAVGQGDAAKDMMALGKTFAIYVAEHGSRLPDTLDAMAPAGQIMPKGIAYVGKGINIGSAGIVKEPVVIAYERVPGPGPHRMSYVLFSNSTVVIINEGKLQEELALTRQAAKGPAGRTATAPVGAR